MRRYWCGLRSALEFCNAPEPSTRSRFPLYRPSPLPTRSSVGVLVFVPSSGFRPRHLPARGDPLCRQMRYRKSVVTPCAGGARPGCPWSHRMFSPRPTVSSAARGVPPHTLQFSYFVAFGYSVFPSPPDFRAVRAKGYPRTNSRHPSAFDCHPEAPARPYFDLGLPPRCRL